jgi:xylulokinase
MPNYLEEATSMGAAIIAGVGSGIFKDFDIADRFMELKDRTEPDPSTFAIYQNSKSLLNDCYDALVRHFPRFRAARK